LDSGENKRETHRIRDVHYLDIRMRERGNKRKEKKEREKRKERKGKKKEKREKEKGKRNELSIIYKLY
jgi:hypothetical protein